MAKSEESSENFDDEIAQVANAYFQSRKSGNKETVTAWLEKFPHLGDELRQALEAIDLLLPNSTDRTPEALGDFRIHRELGRGGMGIVWLATQVSLQRKVALKVLKLSRDETLAVKRFEREAQTVASLRHEHIVPVYAVGEVDGMPYFAMQFIEGDSVAQLIAKQNGSSLSRADERQRLSQIAQWGAQIAEALE